MAKKTLKKDKFFKLHADLNNENGSFIQSPLGARLYISGHQPYMSVIRFVEEINATKASTQKAYNKWVNTYIKPKKII